jgi:cobalt-zinc-cadmium efflux system protein
VTDAEADPHPVGPRSGARREHQSGHQHGLSASHDARLLAAGLGLLAAFMVAEVVAAFASGSLALLADAGHMLADAGALGASLWVLRLAARPARGAWTYGFARAEILSAAGNGVTLLVVGGLITADAVRRLIHPGPVSGATVIVVALIGVAVNLVVAWLLAKADRDSMNIEGAFRHIMVDMYGFAATAIAGIVIVTTGFRRADAFASLVVVLLMLRAAWQLLRSSARVLLEAAPKDLDLASVRDHLLCVSHVAEVHDLHVWNVTSRLPALSAHVVLQESCFADGCAPQILDQLQACLAGHFDVEHSTFQLEAQGHHRHEHGNHS